MQPRLLNIIIFGVMRMHDFSNFEIFTLHKKWCFSLILQKIWPNLKFPAGLITFTEEIVNGKLDFFLQCLIFLRYYVINLRFSRYIILADKIKNYKKKTLFTLTLRIILPSIDLPVCALSLLRSLFVKVIKILFIIVSHMRTGLDWFLYYRDPCHERVKQV